MPKSSFLVGREASEENAEMGYHGQRFHLFI
jgi:hypothetical protein